MWWVTLALAADVDGDGFDATIDCDDADPAIGPATTWYRDRDGDGWGRSAGSTVACAAPGPTFVATDGDCDDQRRSVHPGARERCDDANRDEDCDGLADDADPDVLGRTVWWPDTDGDGRGAPPWAAYACEGPPGMVERGDDCAPNDPSAWAVLEWWPDDDDDGFVDRDRGTRSCGSPGPGWTTTSTTTDCDDTVATTFPGAPETCEDGADADCDGYDGVCTWWDGSIAGATAGEGFGYGLDLGDLDGDGVLDLLVTENGDVWTFEGPLPADGDTSAALRRWSPVSTSQISAAFGDFDGDGVDDVLIGDTAMPVPGRANPGGAYVLSANAPSGSAAGVAAVTFLGAGFANMNGSAVAAGDVDGDGDDDAWIAAPLRNDALPQSGLLFLQTFPPPSASIDLASATTAVIYGDQGGQKLGYEGLLVEDLDGDGDDDLAFASSRNGPATATLYVFVTTPVGAVPVSSADHAWSEPSAGFPELRGLSAGDLDGDGSADLAVHAGQLALDVSVVRADAPNGTLANRRFVHLTGGADTSGGGPRTAIADFDGDGQDDLAVSAPYQDLGGDGSGAVYLFAGPLVGAFDPLTAADRVFAGPGHAQECGNGMVAGDLDGDAVVDLVIGCTAWDDGAHPSSEGRVLTLLAPLL